MSNTKGTSVISTPTGGGAQSGDDTFGVTIKLERSMFPNGLDNIRLDAAPVYLHFARANDFDNEVELLHFGTPINSQNGGTPIPFETSDGTIVSATLRNVIDASPDTPFVALELLFDNTPINRDLFS